ncbi:MAG: aminopeptidase [Eubacteriales bacterium]
MKKTTLRKYAKLIARVGANVQKGQPVLLYASVDQGDFAAMVAEECYRAGASRVDMEWSCAAISKLAYRHQSLKTLSKVPAWKEEKLKLMAEELPCRIHIVSDDPDSMKGVNLEKMQKASIATYPILKPYRDAIESKHQWTIAAVPSAAWAKKVFPQLKKNQAVEALWKAILASVHVSDDLENDPIQEWAVHNENFRKRCEWLNNQKFDRLEYHSSNGTDFSVELIPQGRWCGGGEYTKQGTYFNPNLPTEEIFTSPMSGKAEGKLVATKPLSYQGQMIEHFWIRFEGGRAVEWDAEVGRELLDRMLTMDEGAARLGEIALIPSDSPINRSGILFYETLFDENASCHVALGAGFNDCIVGFMDKTNEECRALGINESMIHVDFMIGTNDLSITGYRDWDNSSTPIFVNGEWAEKNG